MLLGRKGRAPRLTPMLVQARQARGAMACGAGAVEVETDKERRATRPPATNDESAQSERCDGCAVGCRWTVLGDTHFLTAWGAVLRDR